MMVLSEIGSPFIPNSMTRTTNVVNGVAGPLLHPNMVMSSWETKKSKRNETIRWISACSRSVYRQGKTVVVASSEGGTTS